MITEMGFKIEEATNALKMNNGNVGQAIDFLLKGGTRDRRPQGDQNRSSGYESGDRRQQGGPNRQSAYDSDKKPQGVANRQTSYESDRGRGRKDRRDEDSGRIMFFLSSKLHRSMLKVPVPHNFYARK